VFICVRVCVVLCMCVCTHKWNTQTVAGVDVADCIRQVYVGDATATFFDAPVIAVQLTKMKIEGMCGQGGFCSNEIYLEETTCRNAKADWTSVKGSMGLPSLSLYLSRAHILSLSVYAYVFLCQCTYVHIGKYICVYICMYVFVYV